MTAVLTPEERLARLRRVQALKPYQWDCHVPGCDGRPHKGTVLTAMTRPHARAAQLPPAGDWYAWFMMTGRGFGKTRSGAEWVKHRMMSERGHRVACIVPKFGVGRDICVEGESGLIGGGAELGLFPPDTVKTWNRSIGELELHNGSLLKIFGTDKQKDAEALRGFQCHTAWFEELGTQVYGSVAWDMLEFALRLGTDPRVVITSTPRPTPLIRRLVKDDDGVVVTGGSTYDNADNLAPVMLERIKKRHEGTSLGAQELFGELLDGAKGALWTHDLIREDHDVPRLVRIVVAIDPAGTAKRTSDLTGIVVAGLDEIGRVWILADRSGRYSPEEWRRVAVEAFDDFQADAVVAETNFGADMVASTLRGGDRRLPFVELHASRGKEIRATPVLGLYEQLRVVHAGTFGDLVAQMTTWVPPGRFDEEGDPIEPSKESPDRMDAMVWAVTELAIKPQRRKRRAVFGEEE